MKNALPYISAWSSGTAIALHLCSFLSSKRPIVSSNSLFKLYRKSTKDGTQIKAVLNINGKPWGEKNGLL